MKFRLALWLVAVLGAQQWCAAQDAAPPELIPDTTEEAAAQQPSPAPAPTPPGKGIYWDGWKQVGPNALRDQKPIWLFPVSVAQGHHLKPTLALIGVTAALIALDKYSAGYFNRTHSFNGFNRTFSGPNTALATEIIPSALYVAGLARKDIYAQETFFLAARAVIDSEILTTVMLRISIAGRFPPTEISRIRGLTRRRAVTSEESAASLRGTRLPPSRWPRSMLTAIRIPAGIAGWRTVWPAWWVFRACRCSHTMPRMFSRGLLSATSSLTT